MGASAARVGFAGEDTPKVVFPSLVGHRPAQQRASGVEGDSAATGATAMATDGDGVVDARRGREFFVGATALPVPRAHMPLTPTVSDGLIVDWDNFELLADHAYARLGAESPQHPVLMAEAPWNTRANRERLTEVMFEKYNVPAFFLAKTSCLAAYACAGPAARLARAPRRHASPAARRFSNGRYTGIVVDSGASVTSCVPVYDGLVLQKGLWCRLCACVEQAD